MLHSISPLAPKDTEEMAPVPGVRMATGICGLRYRDRPDLLLMAFDEGTSVAGMFTRSTTAGPPVEWCRSALKGGRVRAIVVNAGNANAFTGEAGRSVVQRTATEAARLLGGEPAQVFVSSTGVIGEPPAVGKIVETLPELAKNLSEQGWPDAARAIMTTDTFPKQVSRTAEIGGVKVTINGIAKGSGMLMPDMATMLVYVATDARIAPAALQEMLSEAVRPTFNCITVDGDTSTSDTVLLCATGKASHSEITDVHDPQAAAFRVALERVCLDLAHLVVRDGEGATKFIEVKVSGAVSAASASKIAFSIANSPLVKTAIAGEDANWGRVVMAAGKSFEPIDQTRMSVRIGGCLIAASGSRIDNYDEEPINEHLRGTDIYIEITVGEGVGAATVWTCDLTHGYIDINGSYRS